MSMDTTSRNPKSLVLFTFTSGLRSDNEERYQAYCAATSPKYDQNIRMLKDATEYYEVLASNNPYEVPLFFGLKGTEIYAHTIEGKYERWDIGKHACRLQRDVELPDFRVSAPLVISRNSADHFEYDGDLKPGHRFIISDCFDIASEKEKQKVSNVELAMKREFIYDGPDRNLAEYKEFVVHMDKTYEIKRAHVHILAEPSGKILVTSMIVPPTVPLDYPQNNFFESGKIWLIKAGRNFRDKEGWLLFCKQIPRGMKVECDGTWLPIREEAEDILQRSDCSVQLTPEEQKDLDEIIAPIKKMLKEPKFKAELEAQRRLDEKLNRELEEELAAQLIAE